MDITTNSKIPFSNQLKLAALKQLAILTPPE
jgi:hypothetical protein